MQNFIQIRISKDIVKNNRQEGLGVFERGFEYPCRKTIIVRHYVLTPMGVALLLWERTHRKAVRFARISK